MLPHVKCSMEYIENRKILAQSRSEVANPRGVRALPDDMSVTASWRVGLQLAISVK